MEKEFEILLTEINTNKRMVELLEFRLNMLRENFCTKTKFDRNEIEITEIKTIAEIDRLKFVVIEKESLMRELFNQYINEQDICQN